MNICTPGNCICDGGSDVIGEDSSCDASRSSYEDFYGEYTRSTPPKWRYYWDAYQGVVISVDKNDMKAGLDYYHDPELTKPVRPSRRPTPPPFKAPWVKSHREIAERLLSKVVESESTWSSESDYWSIAVQVAQVHATLALKDEDD